MTPVAVAHVKPGTAAPTLLSSWDDVATACISVILQLMPLPSHPSWQLCPGKLITQLLTGCAATQGATCKIKMKSKPPQQVLLQAMKQKFGMQDPMRARGHLVICQETQPTHHSRPCSADALPGLVAPTQGQLVIEGPALVTHVLCLCTMGARGAGALLLCSLEEELDSDSVGQRWVGWAPRLAETAADMVDRTLM